MVMSTLSRPGAARLVVGVVMTLAAQGDARASSHARPIVVRVYDAFGLSAADRTSAAAEAGTVLWNAGVELDWLDCSADAASLDHACTRPPQTIDLLVRLVSAPAVSQPDLVGFSYIDVSTRQGQLATVFVDRVKAVAGSASADERLILGRAIAHEVVHLVLGTNGHSLVGLMRQRWLDAELRADDPRDWRMTPAESAELRARLRARQPAAPTEARPATSGLWRSARASFPEAGASDEQRGEP